MGSEENKIVRFGRYLILDHLVNGGMASINRARYLGEQADKVVAIKMVQPQFSMDESFKTMFMDEIKVTFDLIHPNIVQTYDYGIHNGQLYVAMEYCDGRNLKEYLDKLKEKRFVFPVEISVYIITQVCQGLHYAHTKVDKLNGTSLNIIHRDISPHNIMLTFDGAIKVIDFGIAKSQTNSESTQAGTIKGKLAYLAPEYLDGIELDPRYDEFAVGITLWEMLCSRRLFKATNDLAVLKKIQKCEIPAPSSINPNVPKELDELVLKILSKNREGRFEDLEKLNRALVKFLYTHYPDFNANDLSYFAKELFKDEIAKDRAKLFEFGKIDIRPFLKELKDELDGRTKSRPSNSEGSSTNESISFRKEVVDFDFGLDEGAKKEKLKGHLRMKSDTSHKIDVSKMKTEAPPAETKPKPKVSLGSGTKTNVKLSSLGKKPVQETTKTNVSKIKSKTKTKVVKKKKSGLFKTLLKGTVVATLAIYSLDYMPPEVKSIIQSELTQNAPILADMLFEKPQSNQSVKRIPSSKQIEKNENSLNKKIYNVRLENYDPSIHNVFINNKKAAIDSIGILKLEGNQKYTLRVESSGKKYFITEIDLMEEREEIQLPPIPIPQMPISGFSYLFNSRPCIKGQLGITIFGEKRLETLPIIEPGLALPIDESGEETNFQVFTKAEGESLERTYEIKVVTPDTKIDLCDIIQASRP